MSIRMKLLLFTSICWVVLAGGLCCPYNLVNHLVSYFAALGALGGVVSASLAFVWTTEQGLVVNEESRIGQVVLYLAGPKATRITSCRLGETGVVLVGVPFLVFVAVFYQVLFLITHGLWSHLAYLKQDPTSHIFVGVVITFLGLSWLTLMSRRHKDESASYFCLATASTILMLPVGVMEYIFGVETSSAWALAFVGWTVLIIGINITVKALELIRLRLFLAGYDTFAYRQKERRRFMKRISRPALIDAACPTVPLRSWAHPIRQVPLAQRLAVIAPMGCLTVLLVVLFFSR